MARRQPPGSDRAGARRQGVGAIAGRRRSHPSSRTIHPVSSRTPHGYHDRSIIERELAAGGFAAGPETITLGARSRAASPRIPAVADRQGTPLRTEIEARNASRLDEATDAAAEAIARRFGRGPVDGKIQAIVVSIER